jgi:hypothetical protein
MPIAKYINKGFCCSGYSTSEQTSAKLARQIPSSMDDHGSLVWSGDQSHSAMYFHDIIRHLDCIVGLSEGVLQLGTRTEVMGSIPLSHTFFAAQIIPPSLMRSSYDGALLNTHMT